MKLIPLYGSLACALVLQGCAWSSGALGRAKIEDQYTSARSPSEVATCISTRLMGSNPMVTDGPDHYIITRSNGYGIPIVRWDVYRTEAGSRIEFRRSVAIMSGEKKVQECFGDKPPV